MTRGLFINRNQFAQYQNCSINTATKRYSEYLVKAGKEPDQQLTVYDLNAIDRVPIEDILERITF